MKATIEQRRAGRQTSSKAWSWRKRVLVCAVVLASLGSGYGMWRHLIQTPQPWLARLRVEHYLSAKASGKLKVEFAFPSKAEMGKAEGPAISSSQTSGSDSKSFETRSREYLTL